jgi:hypothetical protein
MKTPILGSSYVARSVNAADNRMINLFPEIVAEAGKEPAFLQRAPGLRLITTAGVGPIRGMWQFNGRSFVVSGGFLYQLTSDWQVIQIGEIGGTGSVSMADNGNQLFIATNPEAFIYNVTTRNLQRITDPDFPGAVTVGYIDGYFVFNEPNSQRIWITSIYDGTNIDALDFASAEGSPDNIVAVIVDHREVWLFGTNSVEVWYNSGNPDFPLSRIQGAFNELGCVAPYSVAKLDNTIFWLGADARGRGIVYKAKGYTGERISTHAVEWQIQQYANMGDAIGYTYQQDGHAFYVLVFPSANTTWVYDASTQVWHERAGWDGARFTRHRGNCQMSYNSEIVIGDYENGNLYAFDLNYYQDNGGIQKWLRSWRALPTGQNNLKRTTQHSLQLDCETGATLYSDDFSGFYELITENGYTIVAEFNQIYIQTENAEFLTTESGDELVLINYSEPYPDGYTLITEEKPPALGADPQVMLRWSDDSGHTWSSEHWKSMGRIGQFGYRTIWRRLGMTLKIRDRVYEVSGTDPVKIAIVGAELILDPTNA